MAITVGTKGEAVSLVSKENTAQAAGSGDLPVYATPCMVALMEKAAWESIAPALDEGQSSVGISMKVSHDAATPVGMQVRAEAEVIAVDGRKVTFSITAYDERGVIGRAEHQRCVITAERFLAKTYGK